MRIALDTNRLTDLFRGDAELGGFLGGRDEVPDNNLWIAALCLEYDLALITRDQHFDKIPQLRQTQAGELYVVGQQPQDPRDAQP
jgi:predicted nucleic acid-binding protein